MKKVIKIISNCFISFIIVILFVNLVINFIIGNDAVGNIARYSFYEVNGDSMFPKIKDGDLIIIDNKNKDIYDVGDIISFEKNTVDGKIIVTHKIENVIEYDNEYAYVTKGINNPYEDDSIVEKDKIIGEYKNLRIPFLGYLVKFSKTTVGYLILVIMPLGTMLFWASYELINEISKKKEEK